MSYAIGSDELKRVREEREIGIDEARRQLLRERISMHVDHLRRNATLNDVESELLLMIESLLVITS